MENQVFRFRGCDNLVYAEVIKDDVNEIVFGDVKVLAPLGEVGKTTSSESGTSFGDNKALIIVNSEGADEISLTVFGIPLHVVADITGKLFTEASGEFVDNQRAVKYFALGYREKLTNGKYRYIWRYKGTFNIPDEGAATEDDGTDSTGQELTYTGIFTVHEFAKGGSAKGVIVDTQYAGADVTHFFDGVREPGDAE